MKWKKSFRAQFVITLCIHAPPGGLHSIKNLLSSNLNVALGYSQVVDYLENADTTYKECINTLDANPPFQPKGRTVFLYDLGLDEAHAVGNPEKEAKASRII